MDLADLCYPNTPNRSCRVLRPDADQQLLNSLVLGVLSALITGLNLLVILSIACFRQLQSPTHRIILSLALSDFAVGLIIIPIAIRTTGVCWVWGDAACGLYFYFGVTLVMASVGSIVLVSVDRYIAVVDPMHYQQRMSICSVNLRIGLTWTGAVLYCFVSMHSLFSPGGGARCLGECSVSVLVELDILLTWVLPFGIIFILYIYIFRVIHSKIKASQDNRSTSKKMRSEWKAGRNLGSVIICHVVCYIPYYCTGYTGGTIGTTHVTAVVSVLLIYLNSAANPFLYVLIYPQFRKAFRAILLLKIHRPEPVIL